MHIRDIQLREPEAAMEKMGTVRSQGVSNSSVHNQKRRTRLARKLHRRFAELRFELQSSHPLDLPKIAYFSINSSPSNRSGHPHSTYNCFNALYSPLFSQS
jgi:hypothetical protein